MYVEVSDGNVYDITNGSYEQIKNRVAYKIGNGKAIFSRDREGVSVSYATGDEMKYSVGLESGKYIVTPVHAGKLTTMGDNYKSLYTTLVNTMDDGSFTLKNNTNMREPYKIHIRCWVDVLFYYSIDVVVNDNKLTRTDCSEIESTIYRILSLDLYKLYRHVNKVGLGTINLPVNRHILDTLDMIDSSRGF